MTSVKRFNWIREPTTWQRVQTWRANHAKVSQQSMDYGSAASNRFASAQINLTTGMATISAKAANQRIQSQAVTAQSQLSSVFNSINTLA